MGMITMLQIADLFVLIIVVVMVIVLKRRKEEEDLWGEE